MELLTFGAGGPWQTIETRVRSTDGGHGFSLATGWCVACWWSRASAGWRGRCLCT